MDGQRAPPDEIIGRDQRSEDPDYTGSQAGEPAKAKTKMDSPSYCRSGALACYLSNLVEVWALSFECFALAVSPVKASDTGVFQILAPFEQVVAIQWWA